MAELFGFSIQRSKKDKGSEVTFTTPDSDDGSIEISGGGFFGQVLDLDGRERTDLEVQQLDRDDTPLKSYIFRNAWPTSVTGIDLTSEAAGDIETFDVAWRYQHFEASGVNF